jgi:hypothetical protein
MNAYAVLSINDLERMLAEAKSDAAEGMARHSAAGRDPKIACAVFFAPLSKIRGKATLQLGTFTINSNPDRQ